MTPRSLLVVLGVMLGLASGARAANPCRAACVASKVSCLQAAATAFAATKASCPTAQPDRKTCIRAAKTVRGGARRTCRMTFRGCKHACGTTTTTLPGACGSTGTGIEAINFYRGLVGVPAAPENATLSADDAKHAEYMVLNGFIGHTEDPTKPGYTPEGAMAAMNSDVAVSTAPNLPDTWAVDILMSGPFHSIGIIDPLLQETGFGIAHATSGRFQSAAAIDVLSSRLTSLPAGLQYPIFLPAEGKTLPLTVYAGNEAPDPLTACPGYAAPNGFPLEAQLAATPMISSHTLMRGGTLLDHCLFDETSYVNPDASLQQLGRAVLGNGGRHAVVIIAKQQLAPGDYTASITDHGQTLTWHFTVTCSKAAPGF